MARKSGENFLNSFWQGFTLSYKRFWVLALLALLLCFPLYFIAQLPIAKELESRFYDLRFRLSPHPELADSSIVLVAIDQASLKYAAELGQGWPFPRSFYAIICNYLSQQNAQALIFDILFDEPDFYRGEEDPQLSDASFAQAMQDGGISYLAFSLSPISKTPQPELIKHAQPELKHLPALSSQGYQAPIPAFLNSAAGIGGVSLQEGTDTVLRSVPAFYQIQDHRFANLALAPYLHNRVSIKDLPINNQGEIPLFWYGKGGAEGVFSYLPFSALLYSAVQDMQGKNTLFPPDYFKGKSVFIGASAAGLMDLKSSPYSWGIPGMEAWATLLSNLYSGHHIIQPALWQNLLLVFLLILLVFMAVAKSSAGYSPLSVLAILLVFLLSSWALFNYRFIMLDVTALIFSWIMAWLLILTLSYWAEGKHKRELRMVFTRYLHPDLVDRITANPNLVQMGGEELSATVLFSDIYNFTTFSENRQAPELVRYLNDYFSTFTNTILDNNGMLDKYTGDGLMAVFGAPLERQDHALCACKAALAHRQFSLAISTSENRNPSDYFHLGTRIGINSGRIVSGNIGSQRRMEYTSIGDPVNLASRLEGVNKIYGTHIIISESTYLLVKDKFTVRELDYLKVKGKDLPTRIYELLGSIEEAENFSWTGTYAEALELYRKAEFSKAAELFGSLAAQPRCDAPSIAMQLRCNELQDNPPENWQGILILDQK